MPSPLGRALCLLPASLSVLLLFSCGASGNGERVSLPPTPVLSIRSTWAVVKSPLLRVREEPSNSSVVLSHVRMASLVEVLTKSDKTDTVERESDFWYRVDYQGLKGWVFGSYIEIFDSRAKAQQFSGTLK
jgi:hypothetical protein